MNFQWKSIKNRAPQWTALQLIRWLEKLDAWVIQYATTNSAKLFKTQKTQAEIKTMYCSLIKPGKNDYPPTLRCKVNLAGSGTVRCWRTEDGETKRRDLPELEGWRNAVLEAVVLVSGLWLQSKSFGLALLITDASLQDMAEEDCPF